MDLSASTRERATVFLIGLGLVSNACGSAGNDTGPEDSGSDGGRAPAQDANSNDGTSSVSVDSSLALLSQLSWPVVSDSAKWRHGLRA
jgi:hypothetical protein